MNDKIPSDAEILAGLDDFVAMGVLQKLRNKDTGKVLYLNSAISVPPDCEAWEPGHED